MLYLSVRAIRAIYLIILLEILHYLLAFTAVQDKSAVTLQFLFRSSVLLPWLHLG